MKLCKERLRESGITILVLALSVGTVYGLVSLSTKLSPMVTAVAIVAIAFVCLIDKVYSLINWLFIEPFRKGNTK